MPTAPAQSRRPPAAPLAELPAYLIETYHWAYVTPAAIRRFERQWLVNLILWGNFARLCERALDSFGTHLSGRTLQIACVYGDLTARLAARHGDERKLEVIDVLPAQIDNLQRKLGPGSCVGIQLADSTALPHATASQERALLFFLLHEQPLEVRLKTLREAFRVVRPGGRITLVDYHRPAAWHPLRGVMKQILRWLEPFALDLWQTPVESWFPADIPPAAVRKTTCFGGLYQIVEITC